MNKIRCWLSVSNSAINLGDTHKIHKRKNVDGKTASLLVKFDNSFTKVTAKAMYG